MADMYSWAQHAEAIDAARAGDGAALDALLSATWPHAYRIALSILRHPMAAEDAAQEACARMVRAIAGLRSSAAFGVWFYRLVVREALGIQRRTRTPDPVDPGTLASASPLTDALVRIDVLRALGKLPPDLNSREIAAIVGMPDATVRYNLALARRRLEALLATHRPCTLAEVLFDAG
jgi:DNA-directed RNA polymerase specialized sigma24 family protein